MAREAAIKVDPARLAEWKEQRKRQHAKRMLKPEFVERKRVSGRRTDAKRQADPIKRLKRNARIVERRNEKPELAEKTRTGQKVWRDKTPGWHRPYRHRRRARLRKAKGSFDRGDVFLILTAQTFRCFWCDADITRKHHVDHYIPLARGGSNWPSNIVLACARCNHQRRDKMPDEFMTWRQKMAQRIAGVAFLKVNG